MQALFPATARRTKGIYDAAYLSQLEHMRVVSPANYAELRFWLEKALYQWSGLRAIRYPRGKEETALAALGCTGKDFDVYRAAKPADAVIVCYSGETAQALRAAELAGQQGLWADVCKMCVIHPLPGGLVDAWPATAPYCLQKRALQRAALASISARPCFAGDGTGTGATLRCLTLV